MNNMKKYFSIRDLENLSGIKAHTIRIWEKRYNLLEPERTTTNIRNYSLKSLQKLLNITLLYNNGHKISKIAQIPDTEIPNFVQEVIEKKTIKNHAIKNSLNPVITAISGWFASMLAGAVFVEYIFGWNGLGKEIVNALNTLDLPVIMGSVLVIAFMFITINILVDLIYRILDPRVKLN